MRTAAQERARELAELVAERLRGMVRELDPNRVYPADEAADILGYRSERGAKTLAEIPLEMLPITPIGPQGGRRGYRGADLIRYMDARRKTA